MIGKCLKQEETQHCNCTLLISSIILKRQWAVCNWFQIVFKAWRWKKSDLMVFFTEWTTRILEEKVRLMIMCLYSQCYSWIFECVCKMLWFGFSLVCACVLKPFLFFFLPPGKSRQHECDTDLFSECTKGITRGGEKRGWVGQVPGKQSRRWII